MVGELSYCLWGDLFVVRGFADKEDSDVCVVRAFS